MKLLNQSMLAIATLSTASLAFAADPLANTQWQTIDEKTGKATAIIKITESKGVFTGKIVKALDPDGAKYLGTTIISGLKAETKAKGKYSGGKIYDPTNDKKYTLKVELKGNSLKVRGYLGPVYRTQTWKRK